MRSILKHIVCDHFCTLFMLKNHHADYMMVRKSAELAVIDRLHDSIGGYDI